MGDISLVIRYRERGFISSKRAEEMTWLFVENHEYMSDRQTDFEKKIKKAIAIFSKKSLYDVEVSLYRNALGDINENRLALICRETGDEDNDIYTLYKYDGTATDKLKVSKAKAFNELIALERSSVELLLDRIRMSA